MPAGGGARPAILRDIRLLLSRSEFRGFARIEADGDNVKLISRVERYGAKISNQSIQRQRAEVRALVVNKCENDRLLSEIIPEHNIFSGFVPQRYIKRQL